MNRVSAATVIKKKNPVKTKTTKKNQQKNKNESNAEAHLVKACILQLIRADLKHK